MELRKPPIILELLARRSAMERQSHLSQPLSGTEALNAIHDTHVLASSSAPDSDYNRSLQCPGVKTVVMSSRLVDRLRCLKPCFSSHLIAWRHMSSRSHMGLCEASTARRTAERHKFVATLFRRYSGLILHHETRLLHQELDVHLRQVLQPHVLQPIREDCGSTHGPDRISLNIPGP